MWCKVVSKTLDGAAQQILNDSTPQNWCRGSEEYNYLRSTERTNMLTATVNVCHYTTLIFGVNWADLRQETADTACCHSDQHYYSDRKAITVADMQLQLTSFFNTIKMKGNKTQHCHRHKVLWLKKIKGDWIPAKASIQSCFLMQTVLMNNNVNHTDSGH